MISHFPIEYTSQALHGEKLGYPDNTRVFAGIQYAWLTIPWRTMFRLFSGVLSEIWAFSDSREFFLSPGPFSGAVQSPFEGSIRVMKAQNAASKQPMFAERLER